MSDLYPGRILQATIEKGVSKAESSLQTLSILGFLGGMYISLGYLAYIRVVGGMPHEWGSLAVFIGASVFPIGLVCILIGGGELITGNMMVLPVAWLAKEISLGQWGRNWLVVTLANLLGAFFVAWFFGHYVGLTEGDVLHKTISIAESKVKADFGRALVSGIGCNWMVCMGVFVLRCAQFFRENIGYMVSGNDFCVGRFSTRCRKYVCNTCGYLGRCRYFLGAVRLEHAVGVYRQCRRRSSVCRSNVSVCLPA